MDQLWPGQTMFSFELSAITLRPSKGAMDNSEFRIPNSEFKTPNTATRLSEPNEPDFLNLFPENS